MDFTNDNSLNVWYLDPLGFRISGNDPVSHDLHCEHGRAGQALVLSSPLHEHRGPARGACRHADRCPGPTVAGELQTGTSIVVPIVPAIFWLALRT